jgi:2-oxoglutarate dehydrogenase E1 component
LTAQSAKRVVFCTGKIFYALSQARAERGLEKRIALVRIEQLYPFPTEAVTKTLALHKAAEIVWCQEEPLNMGFYQAISPVMEKIVESRVFYAGRPPSPAPAVGLNSEREAQEASVIKSALDL